MIRDFALQRVCFYSQTQLFDTFNEASTFNSSKWDLVQGGRVGIGCASVVDGLSMTFGGHGRRQAITVDLDLRYARSASTMIICFLFPTMSSAD